MQNLLRRTPQLVISALGRNSVMGFAVITKECPTAISSLTPFTRCQQNDTGSSVNSHACTSSAVYPRMRETSQSLRANSNRHQTPHFPPQSRANLRCKICVLREVVAYKANPRMPKIFSLALHRIRRIDTKQIVAIFKQQDIDRGAALNTLHSHRRPSQEPPDRRRKHHRALFVRKQPFSTKYTVALAARWRFA